MEIQLLTEHSENFLEWLMKATERMENFDVLNNDSYRPHYIDTIIDFPDIDEILHDIAILLYHCNIFMVILTQRLIQDPILQGDEALSFKIVEFASINKELTNVFQEVLKMIKNPKEDDGS